MRPSERKTSGRVNLDDCGVPHMQESDMPADRGGIRERKAMKTYPIPPRDPRFADDTVAEMERSPSERFKRQTARLMAAYEWQMGVWGWLSQPPRGSEAAMRAQAMVVPDRTEYIEIPVFADLTTLEGE